MKNLRLPFMLLSLCLSIALAPLGAVRAAAAPAGAEAARSNAEAAPSEHVDLRQWLGKNIPSYMEEAKMPGFSIAIVHVSTTCIPRSC